MSFNLNNPRFEDDIIELLNRASESDIIAEVSDVSVEDDDNLSDRSVCEVNEIQNTNDNIVENDYNIDSRDCLGGISEGDESNENDPPGNSSSFMDSPETSVRNIVISGPSHKRKRNESHLEPPKKKRQRKSSKKLSKRQVWDKNWEHVTEFDAGPVSNIPIYNPDSGPNLPSSITVSSKPIEYFSLFFNDDLLEKIKDETNLYAHKIIAENTAGRCNVNKNRKQKQWYDTSATEIKALLGVILNMGLHPLPDIKDYFSLKWVNKMQFFSDVFTRDRFLAIFWYLHFSHEESSSRDVKVKAVVDAIKRQCMLFYTPSSFVSVDESTISFKGKIFFKVYNPDKPTKFGLKVFVLSDALNGYIYCFDPYYGKKADDNEDDLLKTTKIVANLCDSLIKDSSNAPTGHHIYVDRYYNSPQLAQELLKKNMYITGTVMTNRKEMPIVSKKIISGEIEGRRNKDMAVLFWKDKRVVTMLSTKHTVSKYDVRDVPNKYPDQPPVSKPEVVIDYTKHMGGVDRSDHIISSYQFMRRSKKWYRKQFFWILEVSLINSYILYKIIQESNNRKPLTHKQFRFSLIEDLVREYLETKPNLPVRRVVGRPTEIQRLDGKLHLMGKTEKGSFRCHVCYKKKIRKETVYYCKTCIDKPYLHPDCCFEVYHTKHVYF